MSYIFNLVFANCEAINIQFKYLRWKIYYYGRYNRCVQFNFKANMDILFSAI